MLKAKGAAVWCLSGMNAGAGAAHRQHLIWSINTPSIAQTPHFRKTYKEMASIVACAPRAWTQSVLEKRSAATQTWNERDGVQSWLLHSYTVIPRRRRGEQQETRYYYYLVCNFRLDMTGEWQVKMSTVPSETEKVLFNLSEHFETTRILMCGKKTHLKQNVLRSVTHVDNAARPQKQ